MSYEATKRSPNETVWEDRHENYGTTVVISGDTNGTVFDPRDTGRQYNLSLVKGLWPDDIDLMLMVLEFVPGTDEANTFLDSLLEDEELPVQPPRRDSEDDRQFLTRVLKSYFVGLMPVWGNNERTAQALTHMRGSALNKDQVQTATGALERKPEMTLEWWSAQVELAVIKHGGEIDTTEDRAAEFLRPLHEAGESPTEPRS